MEFVLKYLPGVAWRTLGGWFIPFTVFDEIERQHQSDDSRLHAVMECWLQGGGVDKEPSWRKIILKLDGATETRPLANTIRRFAQPLPGKSCHSTTF